TATFPPAPPTGGTPAGLATGAAVPPAAVSAAFEPPPPPALHAAAARARIPDRTSDRRLARASFVIAASLISVGRMRGGSLTSFYEAATGRGLDGRTPPAVPPAGPVRRRAARAPRR